jgi:putative peptidoglycan lipid II flippase
MLPNVVFELVAGGALAGAVVPLIAGPLAAGDRETVRHTARALLTWTVAVLLPLSLIGIAASTALMDLLVPSSVTNCDATEVAAAAGRMFVVFAPQILLYGVAVVCSGILNAHRRFLAAAVAPLLSSVVVIGTYLAFGAGYDGDRNDLAALPAGWERFLAIGTTLGVVALMLTTVLPVLRLRLGLRPTFRFPPGEAGRARNLAFAGLTALVAQQVSVLVVIVLANTVGGGLTVYNYAWAVYVLPYAVLAVPIATAAFTALSEHRGRGDEPAFRRMAAPSTRAVTLAALLGAGILAGSAVPVAETFIGPGDAVPAVELQRALIAFAPGLLGYAFIAHLGRVLYSRHAGRSAATAIVGGWLLVTVAALLLVPMSPDSWTIAALAAATSIGMTAAGAWLVAATARSAGREALAGLPRALGAGVTGATLAGVIGTVLAHWVAVDGKLANGLLSVGVGAVCALVFAAVLLVADGDDLRILLRRRLGRG